MVTKQKSRKKVVFVSAVFVLLSASVATAEIRPVTNPNGTITGTIDGNAFELPVFCHTFVGPLDASSHDRSISNNVSVGGVEPVVNFIAFEVGYQFVAFIGGEHYKVLMATDTVEALPFTMSQEVRSRDQGKVELELMLDCDVPWPP